MRYSQQGRHARALEPALRHFASCKCPKAKLPTHVFPHCREEITTILHNINQPKCSKAPIHSIPFQIPRYHVILSKRASVQKTTQSLPNPMPLQCHVSYNRSNPKVITSSLPYPPHQLPSTPPQHTHSHSPRSRQNPNNSSPRPHSFYSSWCFDSHNSHCSSPCVPAGYKTRDT
jgi:hypothetical protein